MIKKVLKSSFVIILMIIFIFLISGCSSSDYTLHFKEDLTLDYRSGDSPLFLIDKVGDKKVTKEMINGNKIEIDNWMVECNNVDTSKIGSYEVKYLTNDTEDRYHTKTIRVKDISAPKIKIKKKVIELTMEEYKNYDFTKVIVITDNWDKDDPLVDLTVSEIKGVGKYTITITAKDKAGNISKDKMSLKIKGEAKPSIEEEKEETQKEEDLIQKPNYPVSSPNVEPAPNQPPAQSTTPKPPNQDFLFSDGYTIENVGGICHNALQSSGYSGSCSPLKDASGIYIGMRLTFN